MQVIAKDKIPQFLDLLSRQGTVYAPREEDGVKSFEPWEEGAQVALVGPNAVVPPKKLLLPQTEKMYSYETQGLEASLTPAPLAGERQVIFGIRPCDVKSIAILDEVFLTKGYQDAFYQARRGHTVLVAQACPQPGPTCFCTSMGVDPMRAEGADVVFYDLGEVLGLEAKTEAGKGLLEEAAGLVAVANQDPPAGKGASLKVELEGLAQRLAGMFEHPYWDTIFERCLGCGICTFICPTCYCFDIQSENQGGKGFKFRCWDSCLFANYTLMAGGANPRPTRKERLRNRFLHKLQYIPERHDLVGCVGCGRCLQKCPVSIDITRVITDLREVAFNAS